MDFRPRERLTTLDFADEKQRKRPKPEGRFESAGRRAEAASSSLKVKPQRRIVCKGPDRKNAAAVSATAMCAAGISLPKHFLLQGTSARDIPRSPSR